MCCPCRLVRCLLQRNQRQSVGPYLHRAGLPGNDGNLPGGRADLEGGWPSGTLAETAVSQQGEEIRVIVQAERTEDLCPSTNQPFRSELAVPLSHFLGWRPLNREQRIRLEVRNDLGTAVHGVATLTVAPAPRDALPAAGAWAAEYGTTLWLDLDGDGLRLDFSADDLGESDPSYDWPEPGRAVTWTGSTAGRGYAEVDFTQLAPRVTDGVVDRFPQLSRVRSGYLAFSDPFHGWLALPSGRITAISKRHAGAGAFNYFIRGNLTPIPDLSGEWVWLAEGSVLHGRRTHLSLSESQGTRSWALELASGGAGRVVCAESGECTVYLTTRANTPPAPVMRFSITDLGDRMILKHGEPIAYRVR